MACLFISLAVSLISRRNFNFDPSAKLFSKLAVPCCVPSSNLQVVVAPYSGQHSLDYTVDFWTTWIWTVQVHFTCKFFSCYSTTWSGVGWIRGCWTTDMEEPSIQRADYKLYVHFLLHGRLTPPTPVSFKDQPYYILAILGLCNRFSLTVLTCVFFMTNEGEHLFVWSFIIRIDSLRKWLFYSFVQFLLG